MPSRLQPLRQGELVSVVIGQYQVQHRAFRVCIPMPPLWCQRSLWCMRRFRRANQTSAMLPLKTILIKAETSTCRPIPTCWLLVVESSGLLFFGPAAWSDRTLLLQLLSTETCLCKPLRGTSGAASQDDPGSGCFPAFFHCQPRHTSAGTRADGGPLRSTRRGGGLCHWPSTFKCQLVGSCVGALWRPRAASAAWGTRKAVPSESLGSVTVAGI
jgi:hypothetical protein